MLDELRQRLRAMEKTTGIEAGLRPVPLGMAGVDAALGGGLARGALHEIAAAGEAHLAAATGFTLGLAGLSSPSPRLRGEGRGEGQFLESPPHPTSSLRSKIDLSPHSSPNGERSLAYAGRGEQKHLLWIAEDMALAESGAPYGPGLDFFKRAPERLVTVAVAHRRDLLWAMEEALRCRALGAVIGEVRHGAIDPVAVRRLSLAAAESGALALLLRAQPSSDASTAMTRWIAGAAPSADDNAFGAGAPRFAAQLVRNRRGPLGSWILEWRETDERFVLAATHAQPVAAPLRHRPHRKVA